MPQLDESEVEVEEVMLSSEELSRTLALYGIN
jgi:hypothetical protein